MASPFAEYGAAPWDELTPNPAKVTPPKPGLGAVLRKPIPIWGSIKGAARAIAAPALRMGGAAAAILPAAGAIASKMAGGTFSAGLDPSMMTNALGEGYARFAPTWMGGLSKSEIAAGDSQGASDIEGRFDVPMVARSAPAPVAPTGPSEGAGLYADQMATPRPLGAGLVAPPAASATSIASFPQRGERNQNFGAMGGSSEKEFIEKWGDPTRRANETRQGYIARRANDVFSGNNATEYANTGGDQPLPLGDDFLPVGTGDPFAQAAARRAMYGPGDSRPIRSGTGVFKSSGRGAVPVVSDTGADSSFGPLTAADVEANAMRARGAAVYGVGNGFTGGRGAAPGGVGAYAGALMNQRQASLKETRSLAQQKLDVEMMGKGAAAAKAEAETRALNERLWLARLETDPVKRAAILAGHNPPTESYGDVTTSMPDAEGRVTVRNNRTGEVVLRKPIDPTKTLTRAEVRAQATKNKETFEQGLARARRMGITVTD